MAEVLEDGYQILTTDEIVELMKQGYRVELPPVFSDVSMLKDVYLDEDLAKIESGNNNREIVEIEYVGDEEVQCILVDDPEHLYLTDDFIPTHNTSNIVFLKSTDDAMLDTLEKMSGKRHQTHADSKMITKDVERIFMKNEGKQSITMNTTEEPVISYNDLAFISERNSIVFRAGDSPIWNRNEMILPMSWRLFSNKITQPGKDYTLQTIPTLSSALDFDVRKNQPDFGKMLEKRISQAIIVKPAEDDFADAFGYTEYEVEQLDPDVYANNIMDIVNGRLAQELAAKRLAEDMEKDTDYSDESYDFPNIAEDQFESTIFDNAEENIEQQQINAKMLREEEVSSEPRFAGNQLSPNDLFPHGQANHSLDGMILSVFNKHRNYFLNDKLFMKKGQSLYSQDGRTPYILNKNESANLQKIKTEAAKQGSRVYAEDDLSGAPTQSYMVTDEFIKWLAQQDSWKPIADGRFERDMREALLAD